MLHLLHLAGLQDPVIDAMLESTPCVLEFRLPERRNQGRRPPSGSRTRGWCC